MAAKKAEKKPVEKKVSKPAKKKKVVKPVAKVAKVEKKDDGLVFPDDLGNDWPYYRPVKIVRAKKMPEKAKLNGETVQPGDYIVFDGNSFEAVAEAEFDRDYTPVPPAKRDTHFNQIS